MFIGYGLLVIEESLRGRVNGYRFLLLCATQASIAGAMGYGLLVIEESLRGRGR